MNNNNWNPFKKSIKENKLDYNQLIDQINYPLHYLAYHSKNDLIKMIPDEILTEFSSQTNTEGDNLCHIAAKLNNIDLFDFMTAHNLDIIYETNNLNLTPLYYLIQNNNFIEKFAKKYHIRDHWISPEYTLLDYYILESDYVTVSNLLKYVSYGPHNIFTIIESDKNNTSNKIKFLQLFVNKNNINKIDKQSFLSPLIVATYTNDYDLVKFLLENGADPNYFGPENTDNPLMIAIYNENDKIIKSLLDYNFCVDIQNKYMQTPIHYMYIYNKQIHPKTKQLLLTQITNINATDNQMNSILNLLLQYDNWKLYESILEHQKLKIYLKNKLGKMPIDYVSDADKKSFFETVYKSYLNQLKSKNDWIDPIDVEVSMAIKKGSDIDSHKKYIMEKIIDKHISYPLVEKNTRIIKLLNPPKTNITHFSSYTHSYICFLYYILDKYPEIKLSIATPDQFTNKNLQDYYVELIKNYQTDSPDDKIFRSLIRDYINHFPSLINHLIIWRNPEKYFFSPYIIQGLNQTIKSYPKTKFILFKLSIISNENFNHANILIYDIDRNTIERFDPYGKVPFIDSESIDQLLKAFFADYLPHIKYVTAAELSDGISFQVYSDETNSTNHAENDPTGFCIAWCLWYVETRIKNIDITPSALIKKTISRINMSEEKFKDYIRNYSNYLDYEKNLIFEVISLPKKYWYIHDLPPLLYQSYIKNIRKLFETIL